MLSCMPTMKVGKELIYLLLYSIGLFVPMFSRFLLSLSLYIYTLFVSTSSFHRIYRCLFQRFCKGIFQIARVGCSFPSSKAMVSVLVMPPHVNLWGTFKRKMWILSIRSDSEDHVLHKKDVLK